MTRCTGRNHGPIAFGHADVSVVVLGVFATKLERTEFGIGRVKRRCDGWQTVWR